jgi:AcrR family transcriptional regulator
VARPVDPALRLELLDRVVAYLGEHGLAQATLRPMAAALGVSINRLVHHFGTKEELLAAALSRAVERQQAVQAQWLRRSPNLSQVELYRRWWRWLNASPENLQLVRLGYEAAAIDTSVTGLPGNVRADQIGVWRLDVEQRLIRDGVPAARAAREATLIKATFGGLVVDLLATGDRRRLAEPMSEWLTRLERLVDDSRSRAAKHTAIARR